ncbi:ferritin-like protein [Streptomyces sp. NPDC058293]|uniref:ferritin-like domain-containing protein n=1 Tax=Streptomyces sp. NPDC058293 TaxID=3346429 RepID=UPI0036ED83F8
MNETVSIPARTPETGDHAFARGTTTATDRAELHSLLRTALALEHATIPPYLTAMYSLKDGKNQEVGGIIRSVVMQEMLHLALIGNIMNAVGATPRFDDPGLVPAYPGPLPGGVMPDLEVSLGACSIERVRQVFMGVELPEAPLAPAGQRELQSISGYNPQLDAEGNIQNLTEEALDAPRRFFALADYDDSTIGGFYQHIAQVLTDLDEREKNLFSGDPRRQVSWPHAPGRLYRVTNLQTALWAILEIIDQGEGHAQDPTVGPLPGRAS